jgi:hypothetical protein
MIPFEAEEAVKQWKDATDTLYALAELAYEGALFGNHAFAQSFLEAAIRAERLHERARERVRVASAE